MSSVRPASRILPLHLSPLERFFLFEDRPGYPMTFVIELALRGVVDRPAWESALEQALQQQPLLTAQLGRAKGDRICWLPAGKPPLCVWQSADEPLPLPADERIDLNRQPGLRVWMRQGSDRAIATMQFHHACTDGIGAYRFIGELLATYGQLIEGPQRFAPSELVPNLLRGRFQRALGREVPVGLRTTWRACRYAAALYRGRPVPLSVPAGRDGTRETAFPGYCTHSFDRADHQHLRQAAASAGVMLNDLLLRDLFLTLAQWEAAHRGESSRRRLRIMMPADLRHTEDCAMPAANMVGYTFQARTSRDCAAPDELLQSLGAETSRVKHLRTGADFLETLLAADYMKLMRWTIPTRRALCTAVFSNVADPSRRFTARLPREAGQVRAGNLLLEDITGVPPYRPLTRATISIFQYDRRLTVCLRCDPQSFHIADTRQVLALYADRLAASAQRAVRTSVPMAQPAANLRP